MISGTVFETINGVATPVAGQFLALFIQETQGLPPGMTGQRLIPNAEVWVDLFSDAYIANTLTDVEGRFSLCGVNTTVRIDVSAEGYQGQSVFFAGQGNRSFEFDLGR
jgi:hypothetical protein